MSCLAIANYQIRSQSDCASDPLDRIQKRKQAVFSLGQGGQMKRIGIVPFLSLALVTPAMAEERPIAVQWEGVQNLISGVIVRKDSSTGEFRIFLSNPEQECRGIVSTPSARWKRMISAERNA